MHLYLPFSWFYLINLLTGTVFLLLYGFRRNYRAAAWLTVVTLLMTLFIAGLKLMGHPLHDWATLMTSTAGEPSMTKFVPGGVLFFAVGLMIIRRILKFNSSIMDSMIMVIPWMVIIQRTGCWINGCCYGKPSGLPWAVTYPPGTSAFDHYLVNGTITAGDPVSCGLHPAQLYTVIGAFIVWIILLKTREIWKSTGSRAIFGMLLLGLMRFSVEFFRENPADRWYSQNVLGINYLQWIILIMIVIFTAYLIIKERKAIVQSEIPVSENLTVMAGLQLLAIMLIWNIRRILEFQEIVILQLLVTFSIGFTLYRAYRALSVSGLKVAISALLLIAFTTMSQDLIKTGSDTLRRDSVKTWFNFSVAGSTGNYEKRTRDCSGNITGREMMKQVSGGAGFSYHYQPNSRNQYEFGARGWISEINHHNTMLEGSTRTFGVNPYINYNNRIISFGLGLNVLEGLYDPFPAFSPSVYLRVGNEDVFFAETGFQDQLMMNGRLSEFHLGLGGGFRTRGKMVLKTGFSIAGFENSEVDDLVNAYLLGEFRAGNRFYIKPGIYVGNQVFGVLGLSYNFGYQEKIRSAQVPSNGK